MLDNFSFEITESISVLSTSKGGWTLELNKVKWGNRPEKFDIRSWDPNHEKMGKGVTFTREELLKLGEAINNLPKSPEDKTE